MLGDLRVRLTLLCTFLTLSISALCFWLFGFYVLSNVTHKPEDWFSSVFAPVLLCSISITLLVGSLTWIVVRRALQPLDELFHEIQAIEDTLVQPSHKSAKNVTKLTSQVMSLLKQIEDERSRERRFLTYAAHELRTPISALRASIEAFRLQQVPADRERRASSEWFSQLFNEALRLETFAQNLLAISRAEAREVRKRTVDLSDIGATIYDRFQPLALEKGYELVLQTDWAVTQADQGLLEQALNNLISNAISHSNPGKIFIRSGSTDEYVYIEIVDSGPGLPEAVEEGLGFRVIHSVAAAHSGRVEFSCSAGTHARFIIPGIPMRFTRTP